ncbi:dienelactone hydrolase [Reticulibacter mediterranei]|uniref:Dienelactone hydrolase n=1 Tax=Reticulibacter mediterranei TaxID=2778369 RepID=A0A8J3N9K2_9CHLR|nr:dienelactone hydrolase family protein [Reticulibacter mediterranei]GHO99422.1 dienelactone hydrolase [Reticulibacter mediterranei]
MIEFQIDGRTINGYLAEPAHSSGPGVLVLHAWWGLTEPFRQACDRLAEAGFVALAPDLYHGKTTASVEEAEALGGALDQDEERWRGDIAGALQFLRQRNAANNRGKLALVGFSLGGAYALDTSVTLAEQIAAVVTFYDSYPGLDYNKASATYLCHFAEEDQFVPTEPIVAMEQQLQAADKQHTFYTYPGTRHWFVEENRPEYNAEAARLAWKRTIEFLHQQLD